MIAIIEFSAKFSEVALCKGKIQFVDFLLLLMAISSIVNEEKNEPLMNIGDAEMSVFMTILISIIYVERAQK